MDSERSSTDYLERAIMHDGLAETTADPDARKMHRAMAAEFRRKAGQPDTEPFGHVSGSGPMLEVRVPV